MSNSCKYHHIECCDWTSGIDNLMNRYIQDRQQVTNLMLTNQEELIETIWKSHGPLAVDNTCRCKMGSGEIRTPFACSQCRNLRRLVDFRSGAIDKPFTLECGNMVGKKLMVTCTQSVVPFLNWDEEAYRRTKIYLQQYTELSNCGTFSLESSKGSISGDNFTTQTLITWMLDQIFINKNLPHVQKLHTAFICNNIGYSLYEVPSIGDISDLHKIDKYHNRRCKDKCGVVPLKPEICRAIIVQLLIIFNELSQVYFSHGAPSISALSFCKEPISYMYDGYKVESPITLQLGNFLNSSATFNGVHYFPKNIHASMHLERTMFPPEITSRVVSMAHCYDAGIIKDNNRPPSPRLLSMTKQPATSCSTCPSSTTNYEVCKPNNVRMFRLTHNTVDIYMALRHIGFPLYVGSFDFYCFLISLMCDKSFFLSVTKNEKLYRLWSMMWLDTDLTIVEARLKEFYDLQEKDKNLSITSIDIIRGIWLRCDIISFMWKLIKQGW